MEAKTLVPITEKALYQRINRKLRSQDAVLKRARGSAQRTLGDYYVVDVYGNFVSDHHVDLLQLGRELDVLAEWETLAE